MSWFLAMIMFIGIFALGFLFNALTVYVLCWGLKAIGVTSICGWTVAFSWPLVIVFSLITGVIRGFFSNSNSSSDK